MKNLVGLFNPVFMHPLTQHKGEDSQEINASAHPQAHRSSERSAIILPTTITVVTTVSIKLILDLIQDTGMVVSVLQEAEYNEKVV